MSKKRAASLTNEILDQFYKLWDDTLEKLELKESPQHIWNTGEKEFDSESSNRKVFAPKSIKRVHKLCSNNEKISYTVNACCNADGYFIPLYVLYPGNSTYKICFVRRKII